MSDHDKHDTTEKPNLTYRDAGVDIDAGNKLVNAIKPMIKATNRAGVTGNIGGFGGLFDLKATGYQDPLLVAANDGVGTKLKLAFETGIHHTVGIDLIAMCVNDLIVQGAEPLFFLDYFACGHLEAGTAERVIGGIARGCEIAGCALLGGETAEMPGMYADEEYDLAGFAVGAVERTKLLPRSDISPGDKVLSLASSGVHSNGFSLVRRVIEHAGLHFSDMAPFDPTRTLGEALLTPTKIYVAPLLKLLTTNSDIKALAHITGGGLIENIPRVLPKDLSCQINLADLTPQPVFSWLKEAGNIKDEEMLRTFNLGTGMIIISGQDNATDIVKQLEDEGETARIIGEIIEDQSPFNTINELEFSKLT